MHRAFVGNFEQALPLLFVKVANEFNFPGETVDFTACIIFAFTTILAMHFVVIDVDVHFFDLPLFAVGIHADGHGGAGSQA